MKKIFLMSLIASILLVTSVFALVPVTYKSYNIKAVEKNPSDWSIVEGGNHANILLSHGVKNQKVEFRAHAILIGLEPETDYTLIYYGTMPEFGGYNDVWNHVTCITSGVTNKHGNVRMPAGIFDYSEFINDDKEQKFWIVPSKDLDCVNNRFKTWNPSEILFETETI